MDESLVIEICRNAIITLIMVAGPSLLIMMVIGTTISVFQTVTQINEQTLAMVPKLIAVFASSILLMPLMLGEMQAYFEREVIDRIVAMGTVDGGAQAIADPVPGAVGPGGVPLPAPGNLNRTTGSRATNSNASGSGSSSSSSSSGR